MPLADIGFFAIISPFIACCMYEVSIQLLKIAGGKDESPVIRSLTMFVFWPVLIPSYAVHRIVNERRAEKERRGYEKERTEYEEKREQMLEQLRGLLSENDFIKICDGRVTVCGRNLSASSPHLPLSAPPSTPFAGGNGEYFISGNTEIIRRGDDPGRLLISADVMILRMGRYKEKAAEHIIERTKDRLRIFDEIPCRQILAYGNYIAGFCSDGRAVAVELDIPAARLFKGVQWWQGGIPCNGDVRTILEDRMTTVEEIAVRGGTVWTIED